MQLSQDIPLIVPPTMDQYLVILALNQLISTTEPAFPFGNIHAICSEQRIRTDDDKKKKQYHVVYSNTDLNDPDLRLTASNTAWVLYSDLVICLTNDL